jgi:hypothetical protein
MNSSPAMEPTTHTFLKAIYIRRAEENFGIFLCPVGHHG